jgi:DNA-binding LacI/PurR family transcriptional regulator
MSCEQKQFAYQKVRDTLQNMIETGQLSKGEQILPVRELAEKLKCNYHTVRKGLALLEKHRYVKRKIGAGTFVIWDISQQNNETEKEHGVIAVICHPYFTETDNQFITALHEQAEKQNLSIDLHTVSSFENHLESLFERVVGGGCQAIILPFLRSFDPLERIRKLIRQSPVPVVIGMPFPGLEKNCYEKPEVFGNITRKILTIAFKYFQQLDYEEIGLVLPDNIGVKSVQDMLIPYTQLITCAKMNVRFEPVGNNARDIDAVVRKWKTFAGRMAIICYDDAIALRLLASMHKHQLLVPQDLALIGQGCTPASECSDPPLSSLSFPYEYVTNCMIRHALSLRDGRMSQGNADVAPQMVIRDSCGGKLRVGEDRINELLEQIIQENVICKES